MVQNKASNFWYLLPILFTLLGGIIGYFLVKRKGDEDKANKIFLLGLGLWFVSIIIGFTSGLFESGVLISPLSLLG